MSNAPWPEQYAELCQLIQLLYDGCITPEQCAQLAEWIHNDKEARRIYVQYMNLYASLHWERSQEPEQAAPRNVLQPSSDSVSMLGFLAECCQWGVSVLSKPIALSLLLAVGLPGILFLLLVLHVTRQPAPVVPVATVTRAHDCVWDAGGTPLPTGRGLFVEDQLRLARGLLELSFADGTKVLLEGPVTFETKGDGLGFLQAGRLVANVPKGAEGFAIETPAATIVDLGTEFGVSVTPESGTAEVEVFQGKVELSPPAAVLKTDSAQDDRRRPFSHRLHAGQVVRVMPADREGMPLNVCQIASPAKHFVRNLPGSRGRTIGDHKLRKVTVLADFSGGTGRNQTDQYPGIPGQGWATDWYVKGYHARSFLVKTDTANPLDNGGEYMSLTCRGDGPRSPVGAAIRSFGKTPTNPDGIDLTQPYTVEFKIRVDNLPDHFDGSDDRFFIFEDPASKTTRQPCTNSASWQVFAEGEISRNWLVCHGNGSAVDTGVPIAEGRVVDVRVAVDPAAKRWHATIDDGIHFFDSRNTHAGGLRYRGTVTSGQLKVSIGAHERKGEVEAQLSIDSIRITQTRAEVLKGR